MNIKEVSQQTGISQQAIYKKIRNRGIRIEDLKDKESGQLSEYGEAVIQELFFNEKGKNDRSKRVEKPVDKSTFENEKLNLEIEKLRNQIENLENQVNQLEAIKESLTEERDYLKKALDQAQQLQLVTLSKIPMALPAPEHGIKGWLARRRARKEELQQ